MITNEKQYKITRASLREFNEALEKTRSDEGQEEQNPILRQAEIESLESERKVLREQLEEYEAVRDGQVPSLTVSLDRLGEALALARVAAGLTQAQLAERVGVKTQQIQRYEVQGYEPASYSRLKEIAWALGVDIQVQVPLPSYTSAQQNQQIPASRMVISAPISLAGYHYLLRPFLEAPASQVDMRSATTESASIAAVSKVGRSIPFHIQAASA